MGSEPDRFIKLAIELRHTAHQRINHILCRVGSEAERFTKLAIELLDTAHQRIKTEEKQETNQIKEILTGQLFLPPCTNRY